MLALIHIFCTLITCGKLQAMFWLVGHNILLSTIFVRKLRQTSKEFMKGSENDHPRPTSPPKPNETSIVVASTTGASTLKIPRKGSEAHESGAETTDDEQDVTINYMKDEDTGTMGSTQTNAIHQNNINVKRRNHHASSSRHGGKSNVKAARSVSFLAKFSAFYICNSL